jgi:hypothetical protein
LIVFVGDHCRLPDEARAKFMAADVILGHDTSTDNIVLFYGRDCLQNVIDRKRKRKATYLVVRLDGFGDELEQLCAACEVCKGGCDYQSDPNYLDDICDRLFDCDEGASN